MEIVAEAAGDALICITDIDSLLNRLLDRRRFIAQGIDSYFDHLRLQARMERKSQSLLRAFLLRLFGSSGNQKESRLTAEPPAWKDLRHYRIFYRYCIEDAEMIGDRLEQLQSTFAPIATHRCFGEATQAAESLCEFLADLQPEGFLSERYESTVNEVIFANDHLAGIIGEYLDNTTFTVHGIDKFASLSLIDNNPQAVVQHAFTHFEEKLRQRLSLGPEVFGRDLINEAFGKHGRLMYGATETERERTRDFMAGAYGLFRNPRNHRLLDDDTGSALSLLVIVNVMLKIVEEASDR